MSTEVCIRLSDGFYEIRNDGELVAEVHPTDMRAFTGGNAIGTIVSLARHGYLPNGMRPRCPVSAGREAD
jgi:hypothetical protein